MENYILHLSELKTAENLQRVIVEKLFPNTPSFNIEGGVSNRVNSFLNALRDDLCVVIETEYVDKDYRDAYYRLYSTKLKTYERNCVRLSFFYEGLQPLLENIVTASDNEIKELQNGYLGFVVLRPLKPCIGRNVLSPLAIKGCAGISICGIRVHTSCLGLKLEVWGFPHASQDSQLMTCAETTLWAVSEYFGEKYSHYSRVFPHSIIDMLRDSVYERQIPSHGLTYDKISRVLQRQHFECKIYHKRDSRFKELFDCYVESEFPIIVLLEGDDTQGTHFGHAIVCIGQKIQGRDRIFGVTPTTINGIKVFNWNNAPDKYVSIDDNMTPYKVFDFSQPTIHYGNPDWINTRITCFIVPLHPKIYIEAAEAIGISEQVIAHLHPAGSELYVRTLLTTSRSYREYVLRNEDLTNNTKEMLLSINLPKFVWVTEVSHKESFLNNKIDEIVLIDATADSNDGISAVIEHLRLTNPIEAFENLNQV